MSGYYHCPARPSLPAGIVIAKLPVKAGFIITLRNRPELLIQCNRNRENLRVNNLFGHYIPRGVLFSYVVDLLILFTAFFLAIPVSDVLFYHNPPFTDNLYLYSYIGLYIIVLNLSMISTGLYQRDMPANWYSLLGRMAFSLTIGSLILALLNELLTLELFCIHTLTMSAVFSFVGIASCRLLLFREAEFGQPHRVLVIGTGKRAARLQDSFRKPEQHPPLMGRTRIRVLRYIETPGSNAQTHVHKNLILKLDGMTLSQYAQERNIHEIIVALDERRKNLPIDELIECRLNGIRITDIGIFMERESGSIILDEFHPNSLIFSEGVGQSIRIKTKRFVDILGSLMILMVSLPVMLVTVAAIWLESGMKGSVLYRQERVGLNGKTFRLLKFRSMIENAEKNGAVWAQQNDMRVTAIGRFIRKTRIDELPQLFNVLKGDMSLVGPRPERPEFVRELAEKIPYYNLRHYVMPGITGWAQICFPYGASVADARMKLQYDLYYIKRYSVILDIMILLQTISVILLGKGAR